MRRNTRALLSGLEFLHVWERQRGLARVHLAPDLPIPHRMDVRTKAEQVLDEVHKGGAYVRSTQGWIWLPDPE